MVALCPESVAVYRPRRPRESPLYRIIERYFPQFEDMYPERYEKRYGFWRPIISDVVRKFLRCGDLHFGFARVRCTGGECGHEMFVPFSCRQRCLCPSCHQKRTLLLGERIARQIRQPVPHRQYVWTIPKRLRIYFRYDRPLLGRLAQLAWETILETYRDLAGDPDVLPGMIAGIQTFGELLHFHPHIHALVTDGVFLPDGTFRQLSEVDTGAIHDLWQRRVFQLLLSEGKIDQDTIDQMTCWQHSGFSVDRSVYLPKGDVAGLERLAQYMVRCPLSLARMTRVTDEGSVIYRAEKTECRRFPEAAAEDLRSGPRRNFQVFDVFDFLAELTQHIPDKGEHLVRYYGWYSYRRRGMRAKQGGADKIKIDRSQARAEHASPSRSKTPHLSAWAALIQRVYEVDPLICPRCGKKMKVVSFIETHQRDVIEKILRHCGLWEGPLRTLANPRAPPKRGTRPDGDEPRELQLVLDPEFL